MQRATGSEERNTLKTEQLKTLAKAADDLAENMKKNGGCDESHVQYLRIAAEDARREADHTGGHPTIETYHAEMVLSNDQASYHERKRRCIVGAAGKDDPNVEDVGAADALRDWLRDEVVPMTVEGARHRVKRELYEAERKAGTNETAYASPEAREIAEGYELFVSEMATLATQGIDFLHMARDVLDGDGPRDSYRGHVSVLRAVNACFPNPDEPSTEVPIGAVEARCFKEWGAEDGERVAEILRELESLGLTGGRYVGGTSRYLCSPTKRGGTT